MARYYVDATGGNDANAGTSQSDAWQTIGKVNGETFAPGDSILFKRGETWTGTRLYPLSSGTAGSPITFADYGTGAKPCIDGNDAVNCIAGSFRSYLAFRNLNCINGLDHGLTFSGASNITITDCDVDRFGNDGILVISGCHDFAISGGQIKNGYERGVGTVTGIEVADGSYNILIEHVESFDHADSGAGFDIHAHSTSTMPYNVTLRNCYAHDNSTGGFHIWKQDNNASPDCNIAIIDCVSESNGQYGIGLNRVVPATAYPGGVLIDQCECWANGHEAIYIYEVDNITIQRSAMTHGQSAYYAIKSESVQALTLYNNTVYVTHSGSVKGAWGLSGVRCEDVVCKNNIFWATTDVPYMIRIAAGTGVVGMDIDYNLYRPSVAFDGFMWLGTEYTWAEWLVNSGQDANSPTPADPVFTEAASDDFTLQSTSPAIDAGIDVGLPFCTLIPDCGAYEYRPIAVPGVSIAMPVHYGPQMAPVRRTQCPG